MMRPTQVCKIITYASVAYDGNFRYVVMPLNPTVDTPTRYITKYLDPNQFLYATTTVCPIHGLFGRIRGRRYAACVTIRMIDNDKCIKCVDDVAEQRNEHGRPYQFKILGNYYLNAREASEIPMYTYMQHSDVIDRCSDPEYPNWINLFEDCQ